MSAFEKQESDEEWGAWREPTVTSRKEVRNDSDDSWNNDAPKYKFNGNRDGGKFGERKFTEHKKFNNDRKPRERYNNDEDNGNRNGFKRNESPKIARNKYRNESDDESKSRRIFKDDRSKRNYEDRPERDFRVNRNDSEDERDNRRFKPKSGNFDGRRNDYDNLENFNCKRDDDKDGRRNHFNNESRNGDSRSKNELRNGDFRSKFNGRNDIDDDSRGPNMHAGRKFNQDDNFRNSNRKFGNDNHFDKRENKFGNSDGEWSDNNDRGNKKFTKKFGDDDGWGDNNDRGNKKFTKKFGDDDGWGDNNDHGNKKFTNKFGDDNDGGRGDRNGGGRGDRNCGGRGDQNDRGIRKFGKKFGSDNSDDSWGDNNQKFKKVDSRADCDLNDNFKNKINIRGSNEEPEVNKKATYVPDDEEEDYFLHVNSGINFDNYEKIPVEVTGEDVPKPINKFSDLTLPEFADENIEALRYKSLTPIQKYAIPIINAKRDLMACAQTGSGKTFAFLLPIITDIQNECEEAAETKTVFPKALIMAPTRELCRQIYTAAKQLCRNSKVKCGYVYGGIEMQKSRKNLMVGGCDILVATPGRLIHFLELVWISLKYLKFLVLDEADRMLDADGFHESVTKIYEEANCFGEDRNIQISMFSATFPNEIQNLAKNLLKNYLFLAVGVVGAANLDVQQEVIQAEQKEKVNKAVEYIKSMPDQKTLVFVESKRMADFFGIKLGYLGYKATTIHGDRDQEQRETALNDFKSGRVTYMVATNVAARGLDIPKVDTVINVDMPQDIDTYIHRIGRTGRCGNVGRAVSFFDDEKDLCLVHGLVSKLEEANQPCPEWLKLLAGSTPNTGNTRRTYTNRDNRSNVPKQKFEDTTNQWGSDDGAVGGNDDGFMKGTNVSYGNSDAPVEAFAEEDNWE